MSKTELKQHAEQIEVNLKAYLELLAELEHERKKIIDEFSETLRLRKIKELKRSLSTNG
ncbi:MAG: hypothetical protein AAB463_00980 [Patescibacteria group bacterium]